MSIDITLRKGVYLGITTEGYRLFADLRVYATDRETVSVTHETLPPGMVCLAITFNVVDPQVDDPDEAVVSSGQVPPEGRVLIDGNGLSGSVERLWEDWHLGDLNAGCVHQPRMRMWTDPKPQACPHTGYEYGSAWLVRPIDAAGLEVLGDVLSRTR